MEHIENEIFYHIQRKQKHKPDFWEPGYTTFIGEDKNPFAHFFDIAGFTKVSDDNVVDVMVHYQRFARETIFEEVRQKYFSNVPSRLTCLWVMPDDPKAIEYWKKELADDSESRLLKLNLTGIVHKTNQLFLELNFGSMNYNRQQAFKYWNGATGSGSAEDEYLFQGFIEVLEVTIL